MLRNIRKIIFIFIAALALTACERSDIGSEETEKARAYIESNTGEVYGLCKKDDGSKFRIGVIDIDPYYPSGEMLYYIVDELKNQGWIDKSLDIPFNPLETDVKELVTLLAERDTGEYLEFSADKCWYLAIDGEDQCRAELESILEQDGLDLIICLGTLPGKFAEEVVCGRVPVMIYFSVDPVGAELTEDTDYSTVPNVWTHISFSGYENQIRFFQNALGFNKIGIIYYDESVGALRAYRKAAEEEGFEICESVIQRIDTSSKDSVKEYYERYLSEIDYLVENKGIDAFMIGSDMIVDDDMVETVCDMLYERGIAVFAQTGQEFVKNGALMTMVTMDAKQQAPFFVNTMAAIFNGKAIEELKQKYVAAAFLAINLTSAEKLGYEVPKEIIDYAESIYY